MEFRGTERFLIQRRLGEGGFGVVYEARDREKDSSVALKTLRHFTPDSLYRFKREFRSLADIAHPNLVQLYELVSDADEWFFTMELVRGKTFMEHVWGGQVPANATTTPSARDQPTIDRHRNLLPPGPAHIDRLAAALPQLVEGVAALHRAGSIHRDLKPSNVLVSAAGRVVLLDFGLLMAIDAGRTLQSIEIVGTPVYMSPEQAAGLPLTSASDWYSAGVMLFECLTGELPYGGNFAELIAAKQLDGPAPSQFVSDVPAHLDSLCRDLMRHSVASRPGADEILARLANAPFRAAPVTAARARSSSSALFIGREREMNGLRAAFDQVLAGDSVTVCLHGLSGIGKTSLARHFLDELRNEHPEAVILTGRCFERESVPYKGLDSLIDALARHLRRLPPREAEAFLPRDIFALAQLFPVLRQLEELAPSRRRPAAVPDSHELRRRAFAALRDLLARLGDKEPAVLFVDDLQWGDVDSADLLTWLVRGADAPPLLFIASYRSDEVNSSPFLRAFRAEETLRQVNVREIAVEQLSVDESCELAAALLKNIAPRLTGAAASIAAEAGGSPFFIDELVRSAEGGRLADTAAGEITLAEMIRPRLGRLPPHATRLLQLVAVNGQPVPSHVLKRAAEVDEYESALALLHNEHLIRTRETDAHDEIETYHDRIRETVVLFLDSDLLREHHKRLAAALEAGGAADAEALADHFIAGGEEERAIEYTIVAAEEAERALAFDRAARLYRRALDLFGPESDRRSALQVKLGDALTNAGRGAEAADAYLAVTGLSLRERLELRRKAAEQLLFAGHIDEGLTVLQSVLTSVGMRMPKTRRGMLFALLLGRVRLALRGTRFRPRDEMSIRPEVLMRVDTCWSVSVGLGIVDTVRGAVFQTHHALEALNSGELHRAARAMCMESGYGAVRGSFNRRKTAKLLESARELVDRAATPYASGLFMLCEGIAGFLEGRWKSGAASCLAAEQVFLDGCTGVPWELDSARFFSFYCDLYLGEMKTMAERYPLLVNDAQERGDLYALTMFRGLHSHFIYLCADNPQEGREVSHDAISQWSQAGSQVHFMWDLWAKSDIAIYERNGSLAWSGMQQSWAAIEASLSLHVQFSKVSMLDVRCRAALAMIDEGTSSPDERRRVLREAERAVRQIDRQRTEWGSALAELLRAGIEMRRGQKNAAVRRLEVAEQRFGALDMNLHRAVAQRRLGELAGGSEGEARIAASEAWMRSEGIRNPERLAYAYAPWTANAEPVTHGMFLRRSWRRLTAPS